MMHTSNRTPRWLILLAALIHSSWLYAAEVQDLNRIVAVVNNDVIVKSDLDAKVRLISQQLGNDQQLSPAAMESQVLDRMILDRLQLQLANQSGIRIDDETLNNSLRTLASQNNLSLAQFRDVVERDGYSYEEFREDIRNEITVTRLRQQLIENRIHVTEQEVDNELANTSARGGNGMEYNLGHILIAVPEAASPEQVQAARERAYAVHAKLMGGADFRNTAVTESGGQNALEGGQLGWRKEGQLPSLFSEVIRNMHAGDISDPIRSASGFHIIKLQGTRGEQRQIITQTHARHIRLVVDEVSSDETVRNRLQQLRDRIEAGEDFATLARSHSQDNPSAAQGGDLGWVNPGQTVPEFEKIMNALSPGQTSEPFRSRYGWHIVQVLERRQHDSTEDYQRSRAREIVRSRKLEEELEIWLRRLRDEAYVEIRLEEQ